MHNQFVRFLALIFACFLLAPCALALPNQPTVKVALFSARGLSSSLVLQGPFTVQGRRSFTVSTGRFKLLPAGGFVQLVQETKTSHDPVTVLAHDRTILIKPSGAGSLRIESNSANHIRAYKGVLSVSSVSGEHGEPVSLMVVNEVPRREYLAGVVASEMPSETPLAALKALVVLANTEVARLSAGGSLKDSTEHEAYGGVPRSRNASAIYAAVGAVGNEILRNKSGKVIEPFFHSTCGGMTSKSLEIFGGDALARTKENADLASPEECTQNVKCANCSRSPFFKELTTSIPRARFDTVFGAKLPSIIATDVAGRPTKMAYSFKGRRVTTTGYQFWLHLGQEFGWDKAPGTNFSLREENGQVLVKSRGAGHGVGLCQWGAIGLAKRGSSYIDILSTYFPGVSISK